MRVLKTSNEVTALINETVGQFGYRIRALRHGTQWKVEQVKTPIKDNSKILQSHSFKTRPAAVAWLGSQGITCLSRWMFSCDGDLVE